MALVLKSIGYLVSILSVLLLGAVAWGSVEDDPAMRACLILGMLSSVCGMGLRWASFFVDQRERGKV
jgi:hypothetical protein